MTARFKDWEPRLVEYLASVAAVSFNAGTHDCAQFTGGAIEAMTGVNPAAKWFAGYSSIKAGVAALKRAGFDDHIAVAASLYDEIPPAFAHKGDIGVVDGAEGLGALGIVQGEGVFVLSPEGMAIVNRLQLNRAFRV